MGQVCLDREMEGLVAYAKNEFSRETQRWRPRNYKESHVHSFSVE